MEHPGLDPEEGRRGGHQHSAAVRCLWLHRFVDLAHAKREIGAFIDRYNAEWPVERHDHCTPRAIRAKLKAAA